MLDLFDLGLSEVVHADGLVASRIHWLGVVLLLLLRALTWDVQLHEAGAAAELLELALQRALWLDYFRRQTLVGAV